MFKREYFYFLNERGQLFHIFDLEGLLAKTRTPSGPTFLRDPKFLDFFTLRLRRNTNLSESLKALSPPSSCWNELRLRAAHHHETLAKQPSPQDSALAAELIAKQLFPFVSVCGVEGNYLITEESPIVFTDLSAVSADGDDSLSGRDLKQVVCEGGSGSSKGGGGVAAYLSYGGTLREPFVPSELRCSHDGKLYHPVTGLPHLSSQSVSNGGEKFLGLVGSQVGLRLGLDFVCDELSADGKFEIEWASMKFTIPFVNF